MNDLETAPAGGLSYPRRVFLVFTLVLILVGLDQGSKLVAIAKLENQPAISHFGDLFRWQFATNTGAFLSLGSGLSDGARFWVLTCLNGVILGAVLLFLLLKTSLRAPIVVSLACILAGGVGNLIDRLLRDGVVIDFMNLGIGPLRTGIFNVADLAIVGGLVLLMLVEYFQGGRVAASAEEEVCND